MRIDIRFTKRPLEDLWCQAIVLLIFKGQGTSSKVLENVNRKMGGSIERLINSGIWDGESGEKMLLATQSAIRSDKVLLHGMGQVSEYSIKVLKNEIYNVGLSLEKINVNDFGIHIPKVKGFEKYYGLHVETTVKFFSKLYLKQYKDSPDYILKVLFSVEKNDIAILEKTAEKLRKYFSPLPDCSILLEKETKQDNNMPDLAA
ncbi:M17 family peptidase N-terminal domain-containing protein [Thermodesulfobacteriota bacterium]